MSYDANETHVLDLKSSALAAAASAGLDLDDLIVYRADTGKWGWTLSDEAILMGSTAINLVASDEHDDMPEDYEDDDQSMEAIAARNAERMAAATVTEPEATTEDEPGDREPFFEPETSDAAPFYAAEERQIMADDAPLDDVMAVSDEPAEDASEDVVSIEQDEPAGEPEPTVYTAEIVQLHPEPKPILSITVDDPDRMVDLVVKGSVPEAVGRIDAAKLVKLAGCAVELVDVATGAVVDTIMPKGSDGKWGSAEPTMEDMTFIELAERPEGVTVGELKDGGVNIGKGGVAAYGRMIEKRFGGVRGFRFRLGYRDLPDGKQVANYSLVPVARPDNDDGAAAATGAG